MIVIATKVNIIVRTLEKALKMEGYQSLAKETSVHGFPQFP
jgi:hypothetical protein